MIDIKAKIIEDLSEYGMQCYEEGKIQGREDGVRDFIKGKDFTFAIKEKQTYNQALEDFYNGLADELLWIRERFGDDAYMEARCSVGCLQNKLTK